MNGVAGNILMAASVSVGVTMCVPDAAGVEMSARLRALWDMAEIRQVPLAPEMLSTRKALLFVTGVNDWMRTGDSWVKSSPHPAAPSEHTERRRSEAQLVVEEWLYTSGSAATGANRVFGALACPEGAERSTPVILVFHGGGGHGSSALAVATARRNPGMAAFSMDYNGQFRPGGKRVTQWHSVTQELRQPRLQLVPDPRNSPMYHYVMAARRALDLLEQQRRFDMSRVGCFGISYGGWVALILAGVDERVKCVVNGVSAGGTEGTASRSSQALRWQPAEQRELWLGTYDPIVYAPVTRAGVLFKISSNDRFFWLSGAMRNYAALAGPKRLLVTPNSDHGAGGPSLPDPSCAWTRHILWGDEGLPEIPAGSLEWVDNVCTWEVRSPHPLEDALLYWSPGRVVSCARYWVALPAEQRGNGRWQAAIPERYAGLAGQVYVTAFDARGVAVSSPTVTHEGLDPVVEPGPLWPGQSLWDFERGAAAWRPLTPGGGPKTAISAAAAGGVSLGPEAQSTGFCALTNSVALASGRAAQHRGLCLVVDGSGSAGTVAVSLVRDSTSLDEVRYRATAGYGQGQTRMELPWSEFAVSRPSSGAAAEPWPFNGLMLEGERAEGSPIVVHRIMFLD